MQNFVLFLKTIFSEKNPCPHVCITPDVDEGYCPDCGEYIKNTWYITRCECCEIKQKTILYKEKIQPENNFCTNCGSNSFVVQELDKINFVDIYYAVVVKKTLKKNFSIFTQSWVEKQEHKAIKLLPLKN